MATESDVQAELKASGKTKAELMQKWSEELSEIIKSHGGNISDIPPDPDNAYHQLTSKIRILGRL